MLKKHFWILVEPESGTGTLNLGPKWIKDCFLGAFKSLEAIFEVDFLPRKRPRYELGGDQEVT